MRFKRRNYVVGKAALRQLTARNAENTAGKEASVTRDQRRGDFFAEALAQGGTQIADGVDQAKFKRPVTRPILARKKLVLGTFKLVAALRFDQRDKALMELLYSSALRVQRRASAT